MVLAVVVAVMTLVMIFAALVVVLKSVERAADVVFDSEQVLGARRRGAWIDHRAIGVQEPFSDVDADRRVPGGLVDDERWIEIHLQLRSYRRAEDERRPLEGAFDAHALAHQLRI